MLASVVVVSDLLEKERRKTSIEDNPTSRLINTRATTADEKREEALLSEVDLLPGLSDKPVSYKEYITSRIPVALVSEPETVDDLDPASEDDCPPVNAGASGVPTTRLEQLLAATARGTALQQSEEQSLPSELINERNRLIGADIK